MTVIVAVKDEATGRVWMGGDRIRSVGNRKTPGLDPKVWKMTDKHGNFWAWGQSGRSDLLQIALHQIPLPEADPSKVDGLAGFIYMEWVLKLYNQLKARGGLIRSDPKNGESMEGTYLLGLLGRIFVIGGFTAFEVNAPFHTIGLGEEPAFGALHAIRRFKIPLTPEEQIRAAVEAAADWFPAIGGGIDIVST